MQTRVFRQLALLAARCPAAGAVVQREVHAAAACVGVTGWRAASRGGAVSSRGFAAGAGPAGEEPSSPPSSAGDAGREAASAAAPGEGRKEGGERGVAAAAAAEQEPLLTEASDDPLAFAYRLSKQPGNPLGLPPLEEILAFDREGEARGARRANELAKQELVAAARVRVVDEQERSYATGKRKEAIARVWLQPGEGKVLVNGRLLDTYFPEQAWRTHVLLPFLVTNTLGAFDAAVHVHGGGPSGQAQAVRHGVSKALQLWAPELRPALRAQGLLTRDPRVVERKKPGKAKARKSFQWVKR